jgi:hypothetical protein
MAIRLRIEVLAAVATAQVVEVYAADVGRSVNVPATGAGPGWDWRERFRSAALHRIIETRFRGREQDVLTT